MFKRVFIWLLLGNYLLVVGATNVMTAHAVKYTQTYSAEKPYVHAADCQQRFYLQFDCFDKCNDTVLADAPAGHPHDQTGLLLANGLDFHYFTPFYSRNTRLFYVVTHFYSFRNPAVTAGFAAVHYPPPNFI